MKKQLALSAAVPAAFILLAPSLAMAADLRVGPAREYKTIQAAADAAQPGDRIRVDAGVYRESVRISTPRVSLIGTRAVIDGVALRQEMKGDARGITWTVYVDADDVSMQGFTIQATESALRAQANGFTMRRCFFTEVGDNAISIVGDRARVEFCDIRGCTGQDAVNVSGADARLRNVRVEQAAAYGIVATGDRASLSGCAVAVAGSGIYVDSAGGVVSRCRVESVSGAAIEASGADVAVTKCTAASAGSGINVSGNVARAEGNRITKTSGTGVRATGVGVQVIGNHVTSPINDSDGISVFSMGVDVAKEAPAPVIARNVVTEASALGFSLRTIGAEVTGNRAIRCAVRGGAAFQVVGDLCRFSGNLALDPGTTGFYVGGDGNEFVGDSATGGWYHGFEVRGNGNKFTGCSASGFDGQGFSNFGLDTVLSGGRFRGNRLDVTNDVDATFATFTPSFVTGGRTTPPQVQ